MNERWLLVRTVRQRLMKWWNPLVLLTLIVFTAQTVFGRFLGIEGHSWMWLMVNLSPASLLLFSGVWFEKHTEKLVSPNTNRLLSGLTIFFPLLILLTLFMIRAALDSGDLSVKDYFLRSYFWLMPINLLLCCGLSILMFRKKGILQPNASIIQEVAYNESSLAKNKGYILSQQCLDLIARNELIAAFGLLESAFSDDTEIFNQVILLRSRYNRLQEEKNLNVIEQSVAQIAYNQIVVATLNLAKDLKK